ncbi:MAG: hypothetical protein KIT33_16030 [Candidatus Kapabacteria bacterium]|nr:hypothetical protein [Ignavibacteriota bacterium]MCW5886481.1 hypothetical protein [Candidatus Kapabacteria bacterium]
MKIIVISAILIFLMVNLNSHSGNMQPMILINNYSGNLRNDCLTPDFYYEVWEGYKYYQDFDTSKYANKTLEFIVKDMSCKFELLESRTYSYNEKLKPEHYFTRTSFSFFFKKDDSTAIELKGCLVNRKDIFKEENDSLALDIMLKKDSFALDAVILNVKVRHNKLKNYYLRDSSDLAKEGMLYYEKYFPEACK